MGWAEALIGLGEISRGYIGLRDQKRADHYAMLRLQQEAEDRAADRAIRIAQFQETQRNNILAQQRLDQEESRRRGTGVLSSLGYNDVGSYMDAGTGDDPGGVVSDIRAVNPGVVGGNEVATWKTPAAPSAPLALSLADGSGGTSTLSLPSVAGASTPDRLKAKFLGTSDQRQQKADKDRFTRTVEARMPELAKLAEAKDAPENIRTLARNAMDAGASGNVAAFGTALTALAAAQKPEKESLVQVQNPDGTITYVQQSKAEGKRAPDRFKKGSGDGSAKEPKIHNIKDPETGQEVPHQMVNGRLVPIEIVGRTPAAPGTPSKKDAKKDAFVADLDAISTDLFTHPGLSSAGAGLNLGRKMGTNADFSNLEAAAKALRSLYLNDPDVQKKIAAMKPATELDVDMALRSVVNFDPEKMNAESLRAELNRMRRKAGLKPLSNPSTKRGADLGTDW